MLQKLQKPIVMMVENTLKNMENSVMRIAELKRRLDKKLSDKDIRSILNYLEECNKIIIGRRGIQWIYSEPEHLRSMLKDSLEI